MLLLFMLLSLQAEAEAKGLAGNPSAEELKAARERLKMSSGDAAYIAGLSKAQAWTLAESDATKMDEPRWTLFQLRTGIHPRWKLIDRATGNEPALEKRVPGQKAVKYQPTGDEVLAMRLKAQLTQEQVRLLANIRHQSTYAAIESGRSKMDSERYELLQLKLNQHPKLELIERGSNHELTRSISNTASPSDRSPENVSGTGSGTRPGTHQPLPDGSADVGGNFYLDRSSEVHEKNGAIQLIKEALVEVEMTLEQLKNALEHPDFDRGLSPAQRAKIKLIKETMDEHDLRISHLQPRGALRLRDPIGFREYAGVDPVTGIREYAVIDPETGRGWSGRGRMPKWVCDWVREALDAGRFQPASDVKWDRSGDPPPAWRRDIIEAIKSETSRQD